MDGTERNWTHTNVYIDNSNSTLGGVELTWSGDGVEMELGVELELGNCPLFGGP